MGPRSPNGLEQQQQAEAIWKARYEEAPMALGPLLAINVAEVIEERTRMLMTVFVKIMKSS